MSDNELRYSGDIVASDNSMVVQGYALKYGVVSEVLHTNDGKPFREVIQAGALANTDLSDVRMFVDHNSSMLLGRTTSGTLDLTLDDVGLFIRCELADTTAGRDAYESIKRGDLNQMSFLFEVSSSGQSWDYSGTIPLRVLTDIHRIQEVSAVSIPAYTDTELAVATRSLNRATADREYMKLSLVLDLMKEF